MTWALQMKNFYLNFSSNGSKWTRRSELRTSQIFYAMSASSNCQLHISSQPSASIHWSHNRPKQLHWFAPKPKHFSAWFHPFQVLILFFNIQKLVATSTLLLRNVQRQRTPPEDGASSASPKNTRKCTSVITRDLPVNNAPTFADSLGPCQLVNLLQQNSKKI